MKPEVRILGGLALITAGVAGLIAMNIWTVPTIGERPPPTSAPATSPPPEPASTAPVASASASARLVADGGPDSPGDASARGDVVTSKSTDGTTFPAIRFEAKSRALTKQMIENVEPIAAYLRNRFRMKVVLVGHGDAAMGAAEYVHTGRRRAAAVLRMLVDYGVSVARIGIEAPAIEDDRVVAEGVPPGTVEVRIEPRFQKPKKGEGDGP